DDLVLRPEVVVQRALGDPRGVSDLLQCRVCPAAPGDHLDGGTEQRLLCLITTLGLRATRLPHARGSVCYFACSTQRQATCFRMRCRLARCGSYSRFKISVCWGGSRSA